MQDCAMRLTSIRRCLLLSRRTIVPSSSKQYPSEHWEQAEYVSWFRKTFPDVLIFAIPNGGKRSKAQAAKLKLEGVVAGVHDLFVPEWRLWIEMKRQKGGSLSKKQRDFGEEMERVGYDWIVCKGFEDAKAQTEAFVLRTRPHAQTHTEASAVSR